MKCSKLILIVLFIFVSSAINTAQIISPYKLKQESSILNDTNVKSNVLKEKSPLLAGTLSFIVPGFALGQVYNKQYSKFFVHSVISSACISIVILSIDRGNQPLTSGSGTETSYTVGLVFIAAMYVYAGNWLWSIVDAFVSAKNINKQIHLQKYRSDIWNNLRFGFSLNKNKEFNLKLTLGL